MKKWPRFLVSHLVTIMGMFPASGMTDTTSKQVARKRLFCLSTAKHTTSRPTKISFCELQMIQGAKLFWPNCRRSTLNAFRVAGFDVLLNLMYHGHGTNEYNAGNDLMGVKAGMEETPRDAYRSEGLHHLEIT